MLVRATQRGFFGSILRYPGDEFVLPDTKEGAALFSAQWMEKITPPPPPTPAANLAAAKVKLEAALKEYQAAETAAGVKQ